MIREAVQGLTESLSSLLFPRICSFCDSFGADPVYGLCDDCAGELRKVAPPVCLHCGLPFPGLSQDRPNYCGRCLSNPPPYSKARYAVLYEGGLRKGLLRFKYGGALYVSPTLAAILTDAFQASFVAEEFDTIIPVPIHRKRLLDRGFNQALILAKRLSGTIGIPVDAASFVKTRDTAPQVGLSRSERERNVRGSFGVSRPAVIRAKRILLLDDVATTGTTISEASRTLAASGASRVEVLVLAVRTSQAGGLEKDNRIDA